MELKLPEPKTILRCSKLMPKELLKLAMESISVGIGAPLLSNDDAVIPAMVEAGYSVDDVYEYMTAACWEPLIAGKSCDANNMSHLEFAVPFIEMLNHEDMESINSIEVFIECYERYLRIYIGKLLNNLSRIEFDDDPLLSLFSVESLTKNEYITKGARYKNIGLTGVGIGNVINSILSVKKLVFEEHKFSLIQLNDMRKENYKGHEEVIVLLKELYPCYGSDDESVVDITNRIVDVTSDEFYNHKTRGGGIFKFGLSAPSYVQASQKIAATFDGRKDGEPLIVHISSAGNVSTTELLSFSSKLHYGGNRINGNVVDVILQPRVLIENLDKYLSMVSIALEEGIFQLQFNVVDSETLINAKNHPEQFPHLIVRVWGFSAYFKELPEEYKDILISRAIESEKVA